MCKQPGDTGHHSPVLESLEEGARTLPREAKAVGPGRERAEQSSGVPTLRNPRVQLGTCLTEFPGAEALPLREFTQDNFHSSKKSLKHTV